MSGMYSRERLHSAAQNYAEYGTELANLANKISAESDGLFGGGFHSEAERFLYDRLKQIVSQLQDVGDDLRRSAEVIQTTLSLSEAEDDITRWRTPASLD